MSVEQRRAKNWDAQGVSTSREYRIENAEHRNFCSEDIPAVSGVHALDRDQIIDIVEHGLTVANAAPPTTSLLLNRRQQQPHSCAPFQKQAWVCSMRAMEARCTRAR